MTELAIFAVSSAGVTITVAIAMFVLARRAVDAERRAGDLAAKSSGCDGKLLAATTTADRWKERANEGDLRIRKLTDLIGQISKDLPLGGARERMHAAWFAIHHGTTGTLPATASGEIVRDPKPATTGSSDLIDPRSDE
jgi:hypothetical protein